MLATDPFNDKLQRERLRALSNWPANRKCVDEANRISIDGWQSIARKHKSKELPSKYGHSMIGYGGKLYCFGGNSKMLLNPGGLQESVMFWKISVDQVQNEASQYCYEWKKLPLPRHVVNQLSFRLRADWNRLVTILKWKNRYFRRLVRSFG